MKKMSPIKKIEELEAMKNYLKHKCERNYLIFLIGINTGLIAKDIVYLKVSEVRNKSCLVGGQGSTKRQVALPKFLRKELNKYAKDKDGKDYLFKSKIEDGPISTRAVYSFLSEAATALGIKNVGSLTMRKTFAYHFYKKNKDLELLRKLLGQTKLTDLLDYIEWEEGDVINECS